MTLARLQGHFLVHRERGHVRECAVDAVVGGYITDSQGKPLRYFIETYFGDALIALEVSAEDYEAIKRLRGLEPSARS